MTTPDDYTGATLGQDLPTGETRPPRVQRAPHVYSVELIEVTRRGREPLSDHYRVDVLSVSGDPCIVSYHRASGNVRCDKCKSANICEHVAALREWMADQPEVAA